MNFGSNAVFTQNPNFINLGLTSVNTTNKLGYVSVPTTRVRRPKISSDGIRHGHNTEEATADRVRETIANSDYILKSDFENMSEIQDFGWENISMSWPKMLDPTPLTRTKELPDHFTISPKKNGKANVPNDPDPDPSLSDSSSKE